MLKVIYTKKSSLIAQLTANMSSFVTGKEIHYEMMR